jgi:SAM-dependent methyltransferase
LELWKYFAIGHAGHVVCNPLSEAKLDELIELLEIPPGGRLLDIACGKAELLLRCARRWSCTGVGVDLSPPFAAEARQKIRRAGLAERLEICEGNGAEYDGPAAGFDAATCLGASWIWGGHRGTLEALAAWAKPGGRVLVGEPFWHGEPPPAYLEASGLQRSSFASHSGNIEAGTAQGLRLLHSIVSSADDWDRYEGYQWNAAERYAQANPSDPDVDELLETMRRNRDVYLRWGRDELGWATYLFLKP